MTTHIYTTARARFFGGHIETRRVQVDPDGYVWVWDDVAGHYTTCHSLSPRALARIVRRAALQGR